EVELEIATAADRWVTVVEVDLDLLLLGPRLDLAFRAGEFLADRLVVDDVKHRARAVVPERLQQSLQVFLATGDCENRDRPQRWCHHRSLSVALRFPLFQLFDHFGPAQWAETL